MKRTCLKKRARGGSMGACPHPRLGPGISTGRISFEISACDTAAKPVRLRRRKTGTRLPTKVLLRINEAREAMAARKPMISVIGLIFSHLPRHPEIASGDRGSLGGGSSSAFLSNTAGRRSCTSTLPTESLRRQSSRSILSKSSPALHRSHSDSAGWIFARHPFKALAAAPRTVPSSSLRARTR